MAEFKLFILDGVFCSLFEKHWVNWVVLKCVMFSLLMDGPALYLDHA